MGRLKEKYTYEYFTGRDKDGNLLGYGAEQCKDEAGNYILRMQDAKIVEQLIFEEKNVLEFGVGRGECAKYILDHNPKQYVGVDFSEAALNLAKEMTAKAKNKPMLILDDAYEALINNNEIKSRKFDIVVMLDFIEHIERDELRKIFGELKNIISPTAVIAINTPAYRYDNDVVKDGLDERNNIDSIDHSDEIDATKGMHCNKYTVVSLQSFMEECGFANISEYHFWVRKNDMEVGCKSYRSEWENRSKKSFPINEVYKNDIIEYSYINKIKVERVLFDEGNLKDISIYSTEEYRRYAYKDGNYDLELFADFNIKQRDKEIHTIIDVGCFVGINSMLFAKNSNENARIISFEPNPWNFNRIRLNLSLNKTLQDKITLYNCALGNKDGYESMRLSSNIDKGYSSTSRLNEAHSKIHSENLPDGFVDYNVKVCRLDSFIEKNEICPDVIKVDIEGAENIFLEGAFNTIKRYHPIIYMELHSEFCAVECMKIFSMLGYSVDVLHEDEDNRVLICATYNNSEKSSDLENVILKNSSTIAALISSQRELLKHYSEDLGKLHEIQYNISCNRKEMQVLNDSVVKMEKKLDEVDENLEKMKNWLDKINDLSFVKFAKKFFHK